jgi:hypothetical protein
MERLHVREVPEEVVVDESTPPLAVAGSSTTE